MNSTTFPKMHVSLYVSDINQTVSFYERFFDQAPSKVKERYAKFELEDPSLIISFVENPANVSKNFGHLGFQVEDTEELKSRLGQAMTHQLPIDEEMGVSCCYAKQDKFWVTDPDKIQWEVYYFHEDAEFNDPRYSLADDSASCC
ncbi:MAG: ArsI/CadI family heavy metal resistance metalloenzyme [Bacteroidota bacterium]